VRRRAVAAALVLGLLIAYGTTGCGTVTQAAQWKGAGTATGTATATTAAHPAAVAPSASPTPVYNIQPLLDPPQKYLGLEIPGAPDSITPAKQFQSWVGKAPNLLGNYVSWGTAFDAQGAQNAWDYGAIYFMVWEPWDKTCAQIAAGDSDAYITSVADAIRTLNIPVALSFGHEMNGNWYPWASQATTAAQFVAAWQHIHNLFVAAGATNVIWIWDPNDIYPTPDVQLQPYYPGDAYVDWVGITGYFTQEGPNTYDTLYEPTIEEISQFTQKPIIIAETGVEPGSNEDASVDELFDTVLDHANIIGFVWYDYDRNGDWRIENRPTVQSEFATDAENPAVGFDAATLK
jgi:mannan endo-1,4-beta-mannosidase